MFEAGAISKQVDNPTLVCPYLFELKPSDIQKPISDFQAVQANRDGTWEIVQTINKSLGSGSLAAEKLKVAF